MLIWNEMIAAIKYLTDIQKKAICQLLGWKNIQGRKLEAWFEIIRLKFKKKYKISNRNQSCVFLPRSHAQATQLKLHISYFLQKCKKGKPHEMDLPLLKYDITKFSKP